MTIYGEYYFLENFLIDYIIIKTTAKILNMYTTRWRVLIGSLLGAIYSMFYFSQRFDFLYNMKFKVIFVILIVALVFSYNNIREYIRILCTFYLVNIFFGGCVIFIMYFTGVSQITLSLLIIVIFVNCKFLSNFYNNTLKNFMLFKEMQKNVIIKIENDTLDFTALLDTGNLLKDPISKAPVIIVDVKKLENIIPEDLIKMDYSIMDFNKVEIIIEKLNLELANRFKIIPCTVVGNKNGLLLGIKADYIEIEGSKKGDIILGLSNFSKKSSYNAILNPNMF